MQNGVQYSRVPWICTLMFPLPSLQRKEIKSGFKFVDTGSHGELCWIISPITCMKCSQIKNKCPRQLISHMSGPQLVPGR
jgi:hypothetical protein